MLSNMCIVIVYFSGCNVIKFEINLSFLIKPFSHMTKKSGHKKNKYLKNKKSFEGKINSNFPRFYRTFIEANKQNFFGR